MMAPKITLPVYGLQSAALDMSATIAADLPALGLVAGQSVTLRPCAAITCDSIFAFQDGTLALVMYWGAGTYRRTDQSGAVDIIARADLPPIAALLIAVRTPCAGAHFAGQEKICA